MSQVAGTKEYVKSDARRTELKEKAKKSGLSLTEGGEYDFQNAPRKAQEKQS